MIKAKLNKVLMDNQTLKDKLEEVLLDQKSIAPIVNNGSDQVEAITIVQWGKY